MSLSCQQIQCALFIVPITLFAQNQQEIRLDIASRHLRINVADKGNATKRHVENAGLEIIGAVDSGEAPDKALFVKKEVSLYVND